MKIISRLCFSLFCLSVGTAQAVFLDVDTTHPYYHAIAELQNRQIVKGHALGERRVFKPREVINRVEALKMILLSGEVNIPPDITTNFPDVATNHWFFPYVAGAAEYDIVNGFPDGTFRPASKVTRAEFLKMLTRSFGLSVREAREDETWYDPYFDLAKDYRLLPDEDTPHGLVNRGEAAEIIYRTLQVEAIDFARKYTFFGSGKASYYNEGFAGKPTANGEIYDPYDMTAAHRTLPFGTRLKVYNETGDFVVVRINDRGPYHKSRVLDLSEAAFERLAPISTGVIAVRFEVFSDPSDETISIPEQIRPQLSTEIKTSEIPTTIQEALSAPVPVTSESQNLENTGGIPLQPLFKESIGSVGMNFFPGVELRNTFPQKLPEGYVFHLKGRITTDDRFEKVVVFMQDHASGSQTQFESRVSGKNFSVPVYFFQSGTFDLGIVFDSQRESKVAEIEVVKLNRERRYSASEIMFASNLEVNLVPEDEEVYFRWASAEDRLTKLIFTQGNLKKTAYFVDGINYFRFPYNFFDGFELERNLAIDVFQAQSEDGSLDKQFTNWKKVTFKNYKIVRGFPDVETSDVSIKPFNRYQRTLSPMVFDGTLFTDKKVFEDAFIIKPDGTVQTADVTSSGDNFRFSFIPQDFGQHIVEVISDQGEILFNRAIYIDSDLVLPIYPRKQTVVKVNNSTAILDWVNRIRDNQGEGALLSDVNIKRVAQAYAERMANEGFISHVSPDGGSPADRVEDLNLPAFAENLSYGSNLNLALKGLENSGSHRKNIISPRWTRAGIGLAQNQKGEFYVVQIFSK